MRFLKLTALLFFLTITCLYSQKTFTRYYDLRDFYQASPGAFKYGLYGFVNPAITSYVNESDLLFIISGMNNNQPFSFDRYGLFGGSEYNGQGVFHYSDSVSSATDYRFSFAFGSRSFSLGVGYGFTGGSKGHFHRSNIANWGALIRPNPYLSLSVSQTYATEEHHVENVFDIGIRPLKNYPFTLFADYAMLNTQNLDAGFWSGGLSWEIVDGIRFSGRYFKDKTFAVGVDLSFGKIGLGSISQFNSDKKYAYNSYALRLGALDRTIFKNIVPEKIFIKMDLNGKIDYQRRGIFDNAKSLLQILNKIDLAKNNSMVAGIIINASGIDAHKEILWEIREKLIEFKKAGKKVYIFIDRAGMDEYHFASVADKLFIDEQGQISLSGYILGRSFYKELLQKVRIGYKELRYFKYKSAVESFTRDKMSEADREQRQKLIDDWYDFVRVEVCSSRGFTNDQFDKFVNDSLMYLSQSAVDKKLVDKIGRFADADELVKEYEKDAMIIPSAILTEEKEPFDDKWGQDEKKIAVIYAIGACDMDEGIKARQLVNDVKKAANDNNVKAIVLRVDSPGGDPLASDYISKVFRDIKGKKPVIISQGAVAASGGYWLSMDGDKILASPYTITGSIGVIGSWIYDKGLKDSLGITTDYVSRGKYADLAYSWSLPFIGIGLPVRDLNADENAQMEKMIRTLYGDFVSKVAKGRKMPADSIEKIAQGRVWSGTEGKKIGLVDEIGGLTKAIEIAREQGGIKKDEQFEIEEYPRPGFFDIGDLLNKLTGINFTQAKETLSPLKLRFKFNGVPLTALPLDYYDDLMWFEK